jgi:hypothetical protein
LFQGARDFPSGSLFWGQVDETGFRGNFSVAVAGGKYDFAAKQWNPAYAQAVVDHL